MFKQVNDVASVDESAVEEPVVDAPVEEVPAEEPKQEEAPQPEEAPVEEPAPEKEEEPQEEAVEEDKAQEPVLRHKGKKVLSEIEIVVHGRPIKQLRLENGHVLRLNAEEYSLQVKKA